MATRNYLDCFYIWHCAIKNIKGLDNTKILHVSVNDPNARFSINRQNKQTHTKKEPGTYFQVKTNLDISVILTIYTNIT